jgi:hypothetical protein
MKPLFYFILLGVFCTSFNVFGQIPNGGFENWTYDGADNNPDFWLTGNSDPYISAVPYTPAYAGSYSLKVMPIDFGFVALPGTVEQEFAYYNRPNYLKVCMKANVMPGDEVMILLSMNNGDSIVATTLNCTFIIDTNITNFTCMYFNIAYVSALYPDLATIAIIAGAGTTQMGTYVIVDEMSFEDVMDVTTVDQAKVEVYPNPFSSELRIDTKVKVDKLELWNINGQAQKIDYTIIGESIELSSNNLESGVYFLHIHSDNGLIVKKLIKE